MVAVQIDVFDILRDFAAVDLLAVGAEAGKMMDLSLVQAEIVHDAAQILLGRDALVIQCLGEDIEDIARSRGGAELLEVHIFKIGKGLEIFRPAGIEDALDGFK